MSSDGGGVGASANASVSEAGSAGRGGVVVAQPGRSPARLTRRRGGAGSYVLLAFLRLASVAPHLREAPAKLCLFLSRRLPAACAARWS